MNEEGFRFCALRLLIHASAFLVFRYSQKGLLNIEYMYQATSFECKPNSFFLSSLVVVVVVVVFLLLLLVVVFQLCRPALRDAMQPSFQ